MRSILEWLDRKEVTLREVGLVSLIAASLVIAACGRMQKYDSLEEAEKQEAVQEQERLASFWLERIQGATQVFDPVTRACWTGHYGSQGSVVQTPCEIARRNMAPSHLKALAEAEAALGRSIP